MHNNSTDEAKDKGRIITPKPVLIVPERIAGGLKRVLVGNLLSLSNIDPLAAEVAAAAIRQTWPGFRAA